MLTNQRILKELSQEEGVRYDAYYCTAGHLTIGIGHNLEAEPVDKLIGRKLTSHSRIDQHELEIIFNHDIKKMEADLDKHLSWWRDLPPFAQYVMLSLCFNMGIGGQVSKFPPKFNGLRGFQNTLARIKAQDWRGAVAGLQSSKWYKQVGNRGPKICNILLTGKFPDGGVS